MALKRKASALSTPDSDRRKTRAAGPPEHQIPLFRDQNEKERRQREAKSSRQGQGPKQAKVQAKSSRNRRSTSSSVEARDVEAGLLGGGDSNEQGDADDEDDLNGYPIGDGESDELNISPTRAHSQKDPSPRPQAAPEPRRRSVKKRNDSSPTPSSKPPPSDSEPPSTRSPTKKAQQKATKVSVSSPKKAPSSPVKRQISHISPPARVARLARPSQDDPPPPTNGADKKGKRKAVEPDPTPNEEPSTDATIEHHKTSNLALSPTRPTLSQSPSKSKSFLSSPSKSRPSSPTKQNQSKLPRSLSPQFSPFVTAQKRAILRNMARPPAEVFEALSETAQDAKTEHSLDVLTALLKGTTERGEGNSCLILGPRGCGKTRTVEQAIATVGQNSALSPIVIRLSAEAQTNDKLAMKEMARQLVRQAGESFALPSDIQDIEMGDAGGDGLSANMIAASHLPSLISSLTTLPRPTIIVLDAFDLFTNHARQALLYCLFDTVQSCTAGAARSTTNDNFGAGGLAVIGVTTRVDCLTLMEKRVKSRFSGRLIRVSVLQSFEEYLEVARRLLESPPGEAAGDWRDVEHAPNAEETDWNDIQQEWGQLWADNIENFLSHRDVIRTLRETYCLTKDVATLCRTLTPAVLGLSFNSPWLQPELFISTALDQAAPPRFNYLKDLPYPALALLVATFHISNKGHDVFNFEMLWSTFSKQVDRTAAMPVMLEGASVGMIKVAREVMFGAFENLISLHVVEPAASASSGLAKQFIKYRCAVERFEIQEAADKQGNMRLKHWLKRPAE